MIISYKFSMGRLNVFPISHLFPVWFSYGSQRYDVLLQVNELVTVTWVKPRILDPATGRRFDWTALVNGGKTCGKAKGVG